MGYTPSDHMGEWLHSGGQFYTYDTTKYADNSWDPDDNESEIDEGYYGEFEDKLLSVPFGPRRDKLQAELDPDSYYDYPPTFDVDAIEAEIAEFEVKWGKNNGGSYYVSRDGWWHFDLLATYAHWEGDPTLTPNEFMERSKRT